MAEKLRLGELLLQSKLVTEEELKQALKMQVGGNRRLGRILVQMGAIDSNELLEILSKQFDLPIIEPSQEYSQEAQSLLPRYLCNKYEVFPIGVIKGKILKLAMSDPSDSEAITDIEHYTGKAVQPCLARQDAIERAIKKLVPFSLRDFFNPQSFTRWSRAASLVTLVLIVAVGLFTYRFYHQTKYGTVTHSPEATIYKNHDLMVGFDQSGNTTFLGRGAYSNGYYSISFETPEALARFLEHKKSDLSLKQYEWAKWAIAQTN